MQTHTIRILPGVQPGRYSVAGAVQIADSASPIIDAAKAILAAGMAPSDELRIVSADATFSDMPLGKLAAPRQRTLRSTADYQHHLARQQPISAPLWR
jgi:hypothetical protein